MTAHRVEQDIPRLLVTALHVDRRVGRRRRVKQVKAVVVVEVKDDHPESAPWVQLAKQLG